MLASAGVLDDWRIAPPLLGALFCTWASWELTHNSLLAGLIGMGLWLLAGIFLGKALRRNQAIRRRIRARSLEPGGQNPAGPGGPPNG